MKIFNKNLNKKVQKPNLNIKLGLINKMKYLPAFSKEWKNIVYSFNKNNLKNLPSNHVNINQIIQSYFNLFFKNYKYVGISKFIPTRKRRNFLRRIYANDADIKYTNNKAKITLYIINKEKKTLRRKYNALYKKLTFNLFKNYVYLYNFYVKNLFSILNKKFDIYNEYFFVKDYISKKKYINYKFNYLYTFLKLNNIILKKIWSIIIKNQSIKYLNYLRKYSLLYSLNQFKFNKSTMLSKLTYLLEKLIGKRLEYNIINLKSITYHPDIFTDILTLKIKKDLVNPRTRMYSVLNKVNMPVVNSIQERNRIQHSEKIDLFKNKYKDLRIISHINSNFSNLLNNIYKIKLQKKNRNYTGNPKIKIKNLIFNSINYKNLSGIRLEVSGRLTKRYRADRAVRTLKWKGGLKNIDSSFKGLSSVSLKGNNSPNISYSWSKSKRRIGSFAVKGWIGGK